MRQHALQTIAAGIVIVLAYDVIAATISKRFGFAYRNFAIGSMAIYFALGMIVARRAPLEWWALGGAAAGLADATLGWLISAKIGPGRLEKRATPRTAATIVLFTIILATALALGGGTVQRLLR
ncbi:MAG TPA: hypothetical protein VEZ11_15280 [Thermoanaerobaculia bacterium]|nr:hypothetical protein [Thermoanaerobaculia bacterium]